MMAGMMPLMPVIAVSMMSFNWMPWMRIDTPRKMTTAR
jgi:hypothetical protein